MKPIILNVCMSLCITLNNHMTWPVTTQMTVPAYQCLCEIINYRIIMTCLTYLHDVVYKSFNSLITNKIKSFLKGNVQSWV